MNRGDVVLVHVPFVGSSGGKIRPAVVVQCDSLNALLSETIIAEITSNLAHAGTAHQVRIDAGTTDGRAAGILSDSAIRCERLHSIPQVDVRRTIGSLSASLLAEVDRALKQALGIP